MSNFKLSDVPRINLEHGKELLDPVGVRKIKIKQELDSRRLQFLSNWELKEKRILNLKNSRKIEKVKTIAKNKIKNDENKFRIAEMRDFEYHRILNLRNKFKIRDKKIMSNLKNLKRFAFAKKLEEDYNRYWTKIDRHTRTTEINKLLIERCLDHIYPTVEEEEMIDETGNENDEIEKETESSENCLYIPVSYMIIQFNRRQFS